MLYFMGEIRCSLLSQLASLRPDYFPFSGQNTKCRYLFFFNTSRNILVIKLSEFAEIFTFSTPAPEVLDLAEMAHCETPSLI